MKFLRMLVAVVLAAFSFGASAQVFSVPDCFPKTLWTPTGTGTDWVSGSEPKVTPTGVRISWRGMWCPDGSGGWKAYVHRCVEGRTCLNVRSLEAEFHTATRTPDPLLALQNAIKKYETAPLPNELEDWRFAGAKALVELDKIKPKPSVFKVKTNPACTSVVCTRPAYTLSNGVRGTQEVARAEVGQECKMTRPVLASGNDFWAEFGPVFNPGIVALCAKQ